MRSDEQLVADYRASRSEKAFAEIVARHAGMVLRTSMRLLHSVPEAEDVTQAVFLVLAQRPAAVDRNLAGWLHEVARRTACKAIRARSRRVRHEAAAGQRAVELRGSTAMSEPSLELREELDAALDRLPTRLREAVVLRYLEGREQEEAARLAGCPRATLVARATEGLDRLRAVLGRRGVVVSAGVLTGFLAAETASSAVPVATLTTLSASTAAAAAAKVGASVLLAKSAVQGMAWAKAQFYAVVITVAAVGVAAPVAAYKIATRPPAWTALTVERASLTGHTDLVRSVAFAPDGKTFATGSYDGTAKLWDAATGAELARLPGTGHVHRVEFAPDSRMLATADDSGAIKCWDVPSGARRSPFPAPLAGKSFVTFSLNGRLVASGINNDVKLFDAATGKELATLQGHTNQVNPNSEFSPDNRLLATGSYDHTVRVWDVARRQVRFVLRGHTECVPGVAFSPDGRTLASASWDHTVRLWDLAAGEEKAILRGHADKVDSVAFAPDGKFLASGSWDKTIRLWDAKTGETLATLTGHTAGVCRIAFSPDGRTLASGASDKTLKLWGAGPPLPASRPVLANRE
jgi:RNA polymerase sigma factor (sigma-70 family)